MKIWWDWDQYGDFVKQKLKKYDEEEREVYRLTVEDYLRQFNPQNYNYIHISENELLTEELIREFADYFNWKEIFRTQTMLSRDFMRQFRDRLDWTEVNGSCLKDPRDFGNEIRNNGGLLVEIRLN